MAIAWTGRFIERIAAGRGFLIREILATMKRLMMATVFMTAACGAEPVDREWSETCVNLMLLRRALNEGQLPEDHTLRQATTSSRLETVDRRNVDRRHEVRRSVQVQRSRPTERRATSRTATKSLLDVIE